MSERLPGSWGVLGQVASFWPVVVGVVAVIGGYYSLDSRVTNNSTEISVMLSHDINARVQTLEDEESNDKQNFNMQVAGVQAQVQAIQQEEHDLNNSLSGITQSLATLQAQIQFLIGQNWPGVKVPSH